MTAHFDTLSPAEKERIGYIEKSFRTSPKEVPQNSTASVVSNAGGDWRMGDRGRVGRPRARMYRRWAEGSEWIRAALDVRKTQISQSEWDIVKFDPTGPEPSPALAMRI